MAMIDKKAEPQDRRRKIGPVGMVLNAAVVLAAAIGAFLLLGGS